MLAKKRFPSSSPPAPCKSKVEKNWDRACNLVLRFQWFVLSLNAFYQLFSFLLLHTRLLIIMVGLWLESEFAHSWQQSNRAQKGCSGFALEQSNPNSGFRYAHYYSFTCLCFFTVQLVGWFLLNVFHCSWEMTFTPAMFSVWVVCVWSVCVSWFVCVCCLLICCRYFLFLCCCCCCSVRNLKYG